MADSPNADCHQGVREPSLAGGGGGGANCLFSSARFSQVCISEVHLCDFSPAHASAAFLASILTRAFPSRFAASCHPQLGSEQTLLGLGSKLWRCGLLAFSFLLSDPFLVTAPKVHLLCGSFWKGGLGCFKQGNPTKHK